MREPKRCFRGLTTRLFRKKLLANPIKARTIDARIVMAVHDAIWVEAPEEKADQVRNLIRTVMASAAKLNVPLGVDVE